MFRCCRNNQASADKDDLNLSRDRNNYQKSEDVEPEKTSFVTKNEDSRKSSKIYQGRFSIKKYSTRNFKNPFKKRKIKKSRIRDNREDPRWLKKKLNKFNFYKTQNGLPEILEEKGESGLSSISLVKKRLEASKDSRMSTRVKQHGRLSSQGSSKNGCCSDCQSNKETLIKTGSGNLKTLLRKLSGKSGKKFMRRKMDVSHRTSFERYFTERLGI